MTIPVDTGNYTVLIVDDNENNLQLAAKTIHAAGYEVILAKDGFSAMEICDKIIPDAILMDIVMPVMDGLETCRRIKKNPICTDIPVIFLSAAGEEEKIEEGLDAGGTDFVMKPLHDRILLARLKSHIERGIYQRSLRDLNEELKIKNEKIIRNQTYLHAILEGTPVPQFVLDRNHMVVSWNRAMADFSGIRSEDIIGTNHHWTAFYPEFRPCLSDLLLDGKIENLTDYYQEKIRRSSFMDGAYEVLDLLVNRKNEPRWFFFTASPIPDETGEILGAVETILDLSDQKRAEESLKQAVMKLQLLGSITRHDILNKITALFGYLALIREQIPESETMEYIDRSRDIAEVIRKQILFTRDYQSVGIEAPIWQNLQETIVKISASLDRGTIGVCNFPENIDIYGDPLLEKVFYNLVDNALRHGENLTEIRFLTRFQGKNLILICQDDGCGVPTPEKENIFYRKYFKNSGLGLFLSKEILQITGFSIRETGKEGSGACFEIMIPEGYYQYHDQT